MEPKIRPLYKKGDRVYLLNGHETKNTVIPWNDKYDNMIGHIGIITGICYADEDARHDIVGYGYKVQITAAGKEITGIFDEKDLETAPAVSGTAAVTNTPVTETAAKTETKIPSAIEQLNERSRQMTETVIPQTQTSGQNALNYDPIRVIHNWGLDFDLGTVVSYIAKASMEQGQEKVDDLESAAQYLQYAVDFEKENTGK